MDLPKQPDESLSFEAVFPSESSSDKPNSLFESVLQYFSLPKRLAHSYFVRRAIKILYPAYYLSKESDLDLHRKNLLEKTKGIRISLLTPDKIALDMIVIPGQSDQVIIFSHGNCGFYEDLDTPYHLDLLLDTKATIILYNPRGIGESEGFPSPHGFSVDLFTIYQYLIESKKTDPKNVLLYGMSFGGAVSLLGATLIQEHYPDHHLKVINERSFRDLALLVNCRLGGGVLGTIARFVIKFIGWDVNCEKAFSKIKGKKCVIYHKLDQTIPYRESLYHPLQTDIAENHIELTEPEKRTMPLDDLHARSFYSEERQKILRLINELNNS